MKEQPSKSACRNHSSKTSKIASSRSAPVVRAAARLGVEPVHRPALLAFLQEGEHELVLRVEVAVEAHLRHAGGRDDPVHAHGPYSVMAEQVVGGVEDPLAAERRAGARRIASTIRLGRRCVGAHPKHLDVAAHALEAPASRERPVVAVRGGVVHLLGGHDAAAPGE